MKKLSKHLAFALAAAQALAGCAGETGEGAESADPVAESDEVVAGFDDSVEHDDEGYDDEGYGDEESDVGSTSLAVIDEPLCELLANAGNSLQGFLLNELRSAVQGRKTSVGLRDGKYLEVTDVTSASFSGCRLKMRLQLKLRRPGIRKNAYGHADVSGTLYAAKQRVLQPEQGWITRDRACLRKMDTDNIDLSNTANIGEAIFERNADKKDGDCFAAGELWTQLENGIRLANAVGGRLPPLTYETLPERRVDGWIFGAIGDKWKALGGENFFGAPLDVEKPTVDGVGRRQPFVNADISWHPTTGAWEVHGAIRDKWKELGAEAWGYPVTDELGTPDGIGRFNHFAIPDVEERSIYWTPQTGAVGIRGAIRQSWADQGWEFSSLGYTTAEEGQFGSRYGQPFERGFMVWDGSRTINAAL